MNQLDREKEITEKLIKNCPTIDEVMQRERDYSKNNSYIYDGVKYESSYANADSTRRIGDSFPNERADLDEIVSPSKLKQKIKVFMLSIKKH